MSRERKPRRIVLRREGAQVALFPRYLRNNSTESGEVRPEPGDWLGRIGALTAGHREARAEDFGRRARYVFHKRIRQDHSKIWAARDAEWFRSRERGQRERIERVENCGANCLHVACMGCGEVREQRSGCRVALLCFPCRAAIAAEKRRIFVQARNAALSEAAQRGLLRPDRRGGRWTEKFLTLTLPHFSNQTIRQRIHVAWETWTRFLRKLNRFWKERGVRTADWFRVFEWTPGADDRGHPHFHLWLLSPYLPHAELEQWWREALLTAPTIRDNLVFELGLCFGALGRRRTILFVPKGATLALPSDLEGLTLARYEAQDGPPTNKPWLYALQIATVDVAAVLHKELAHHEASEEQRRARLLQDRRRQAVQRLHRAVTQLRDLFIALPSEALAALGNKVRFDEVKRGASVHVRKMRVDGHVNPRIFGEVHR